MANYMWLVSTKNKEDFKDVDKLEKLLQEEFPEYLFRKGAHSDIHPATEIIVYKKFGDTKPSLVLGDQNYWTLFRMVFEKFDLIENTQEFIDELDKLGFEELTDKFLYYEDDMDKKNAIMIRRTAYHEDIHKVSKWISWYFQAFWFDEGIHPEYIPPYKENPNISNKPNPKRRIFSFDFFRKKNK